MANVCTAAFWNSDYRPTVIGVKSSDELMLFENCKNIIRFLPVRDVTPSTVRNAWTNYSGP